MAKRPTPKKSAKTKASKSSKASSPLRSLLIAVGIISLIVTGVVLLTNMKKNDVKGVSTSSAAVKGGYNLHLGIKNVEVKPGSQYRASAILKQNGTVVKDFSRFTYTWKVANSKIATIIPEDQPYNDGCLFDIQKPCPQNYVSITGVKEGNTVITVTVTDIQTKRRIATGVIRVKVTKTPFAVKTPRNEKAAVVIRTENVLLMADELAITIGNEKYTLNNKVITAQSSPVSPDGTPRTTLELTWNQFGKEMRMYMYLEKNNNNTWKATEIRTYNGEVQPSWIYYPGFEGGDVRGTYKKTNLTWNSVAGSSPSGKISAKSLRIRAFTSNN